MREIESKEITETVSRLYQEANFDLPDDVVAALTRARELETSEVGRGVIDRILENMKIAAAERVPLCQDCGAATVFLEIGQDAHINGGDLSAAINEGIRRACLEGYLRQSMVQQPFSARQNTRDNTPAIVHTEIVSGEKLKITVLPKGAGSENMTRLTMPPPSAGRQGVIDAVVKAVNEAGSNPCPPVILGVGIGGTAEKTLLIAKKALLRKIGQPALDRETAQLEADILDSVNRLGIGPAGYGGTQTALAVHVETFPAHIASLPVAVCIQCHSARHKEAIL